MSNLRTAAQQALEALDAYSWEQIYAARTALRAALEQQAEPAATFAENATTQQRVVETPPSDYRRGYWDGFNIGKREGRIEAEDALAQQAEPEPVGWRIRAVGATGDYGPWRAHWQSARPSVNQPQFCEFEALYTAPPQRKPLTDAEIQELSQQHKFDSRMEKFVRVIERAHGIGEEE